MLEPVARYFDAWFLGDQPDNPRGAPAQRLAGLLRERGIPARIATPGEAREAAWFPPGEPPPLRSTATRLPRGALDALRFPPRLALR